MVWWRLLFHVQVTRLIVTGQDSVQRITEKVCSCPVASLPASMLSEDLLLYPLDFEPCLE